MQSKLAHIKLGVSDLKRSVEWYSKHTLKSVYTDFKASSFATGSKEANCFF